MLNGTKWTLMAWSFGVADYVSVGGTLEAVKAGFNPDPMKRLNMAPIQRELEILAVEHPDAVVSDVIESKDWVAWGAGDIHTAALEGR